MKILQLCKKFPFPLKDGESIAVTYLTRALVDLGCEVTLLSMNTSKHYLDVNELPADFNHYKQIYTVDVDNRLKVGDAFANLFSDKSYHVSRFESKEFAEKLIETLQSDDFDVVQLETLYLSPYIDLIKQHSDAIVTMRSHNIEFEIWERISQGTGFLPKKLYLNHLTKKLKKYELEKLNDYDYLLAISQRDLDQFKKLGYKNGAMATPIGLQLDNYKINQQTVNKSICFIGAMDWIPNAEGFNWFLEKVWPLVHKANPEAQFHVAGRNTPPDLLALKSDNVFIHGEVDDAIEFIGNHDLMVVPLFSGSGMRVKIIEAMALEKCIVSTSLGAEGINVTDGANISLADDAETFAAQILALIDDHDKRKQIGENARRFVMEYYDQKHIALALVEKYKYIKEKSYYKRHKS
ncbi:MAG: glycosyltransferase [Saprospiraceae bacterium]|nr:glycosyltransferase [Saprospiraceae bacterium]MBK8633737.1 glycosyltransferase [Saprospiraceae bacterium]MBP7643748.1 glycosyltransferase [Saprospiraceae bacterium]